MNTLAWTLSLWLLLPDYSIWKPTQLCGGITDEQTDTCIYAQFDEFELYKTSNATTTISINMFKHLHVSFKLMQFVFLCLKVEHIEMKPILLKQILMLTILYCCLQNCNVFKALTPPSPPHLRFSIFRN